MEGLIEKIQARLRDGAYPNEAAISFAVVMPIIRALGWDDSDPDQVIPEYASGGRRVDFALCKTAKHPTLFIEVKGVGRVLDGDRQLFEYAFHAGIPLCLLTDGREWSFFLPGGQGSYDERRLYCLKLDERSASECVQVLKRYLGRDRIKSGDALDDAMRDYRDIASKRDASRNLPKAWAKLVSEPEDLLVELLCIQTEATCGFRPSSDDAIRFLRLLTPVDNQAALRAVPNQTHSLPTIDVVAPRGAPSRVASGRVVHFELLGTRREAPNASSAMVEILSDIASRHPEKLPAIAMAVQGRSRNHIARTPEEIYPSRPDLARAAEIAPGWLVGLNIANREKMRIVRETCRVVGLNFGKDVVLDLPNADA